MSALLELGRYGSVPRLDANLHRFENAVLEAVIDTVLSHFREKGAQVDSHRFQLPNGKRYELRWEFLPITRQLRIFVLPPARALNLTEEVIAINHVGLIRHVSVHWPVEIARCNKSLPRSIEKFLIESYTDLKYFFIDKYDQAHSKLMLGIWPMLRAEFEKRGLESCIGVLSPSVTHLGSMKFRYSLDPDSIKRVLREFQRVQAPEFSPLELTLALALEEIGHTVNILNRNFNPGATLTLPTDKFVSFDTNRKIFVAEATVLASERFVDFNVCRVSDYMFQIGMPGEVISEILPVLNEIRQDLSDRFETNLSSYLKLLRKFRTLPFERGEVAYQAGKFGVGILDGVINLAKGGGS